MAGGIAGGMAASGVTLIAQLGGEEKVPTAAELTFEVRRRVMLTVRAGHLKSMRNFEL